jgi:hypothetical protein
MNRRLLAALVLVELIVVALSAHRYGNGGVLSTLGALILAPLAVVSTAFAGRRIAGPRFGVFAATVYVALPVIGDAYALSTYRSTFLHRAEPWLLGLHATGWLAVAILVALGLALLPEIALPAVGIALAIVAVVCYGTDDLSAIRLGLHETAWSIAAAEWFLIAGVLGVAWRSWRVGIGFAGVVVFWLLRAAHGGYDDAAFWRELAPAATAAALLLSSPVLLLPRLRLAPSPTRAQ